MNLNNFELENFEQFSQKLDRVKQAKVSNYDFFQLQLIKSQFHSAFDHSTYENYSEKNVNVQSNQKIIPKKQSQQSIKSLASKNNNNTSKKMFVSFNPNNYNEFDNNQDFNLKVQFATHIKNINMYRQYFKKNYEKVMSQPQQQVKRNNSFFQTQMSSNDYSIHQTDVRTLKKQSPKSVSNSILFMKKKNVKVDPTIISVDLRDLNKSYRSQSRKSSPNIQRQNPPMIYNSKPKKEIHLKLIKLEQQNKQIAEIVKKSMKTYELIKKHKSLN